MKLLENKVLRRLAALAGLGLTVGLAVAIGVAVVFVPTLPSAEQLREVRLKVPLRVYAAGGELIGEFGEERRLPVHIAQVPPLLIKAILAAEDDSFYSHRGVDLPGIARAALANLRRGEHEQGASTITMQVARNYFLSPEKTYTRKIREILLALKIERELSKDEILELYVNKIFLGHRAYGFAAAAQVYYGKGLGELDLAQLAMLAGLPKAPSRTNPITSPEGARARREYVLRRMRKLEFISEEEMAGAMAAPMSATRHSMVVELDAPYVAEMVRQYMVDRYGSEAYSGGYRVYTTVIAANQVAAQDALRSGLLDYEWRHGYRGPAGHIEVGGVDGKAGLDEALSNYAVTGGLVPGVVLEVKERAASVYLRDGRLVDLPWTGMSWARRFVNVNAAGAAPRTAGDVLHLGDVVYLSITDGGAKVMLAQVPEIAGALVSLRPADGAILALTGGFDFHQSKFNRAIQAERQPGSNIKPFIYSAALEKGFTAASRVSGAPIVVKDVSLEDIWRPENYSGKFFGPTPLRVALMKSLNLVSIRLLRAITPDFAVQHLTKFGFDREKLPDNLSLALGTASLTPLSVVRGFTVFATGGYLVDPYLVARVEDSDGKVIEKTDPAIVCPTCPPPDPEHPSDTHLARRVISAENAFVMTTMMRDVIRFGTGRRALELGREDIVGKTGTTNDYRDAWFSGFNSDVATTVWVGYDQPSTLGRSETGGRAALPIWIDYMRVALAGLPQRPWVPPLGVTTALVNRETGQPTTPDDPESYEEYFIVGLDRIEELHTGDEPETASVAPSDPSAPEKKIPEGLF